LPIILQSFSDIGLLVLNNETTAGFVVGVDNNYYYTPMPIEEGGEANFSAVITPPIQEILDSF
jgi:hypothetical protein